MPTLEPLSQWICDRCGDTVGKENGWLEWVDDAPGAREFHIVHNRGRCHHHASRDGCSDMHIDAFLGPDGLQNLLSMLDMGPLLSPDGPQQRGVADVRSYVDTLRRLHVPHYEEARRYFDAARSDGYFGDHNEVSIFLPRTCLAIIERYETAQGDEIEGSRMFAYARAAIDFWPGWLTEAQYLQLLNEMQDPATEIAQYNEFRDKALALGHKVGWEGDIREGPFIAGLPTNETGNDGHIMIAWKQDNNGDTFVVSPFKLPWLEVGDYGEWASGDGQSSDNQPPARRSH